MNKFLFVLLLFLCAAARSQDNSCDAKLPLVKVEVGHSKLDLELLASVLNSNNATEKEYQTAVESWPDDQDIWPFLKSSDAKNRFAAYVVKLDKTNERDYYSFPNLCTGFASQFYLRYSSRATLKEADRERIQQQEAKVDLKGFFPNKYKMPVFMATYPGHFFNAIIIDESRPNAIDSYLILEPQNDEWITPQHPHFKKYAIDRGITFVDLTGFNQDMQYETVDKVLLLPDASGEHRPVPLTAKFFAPSFFIAEGGEQNFQYQLNGRSYEQYISDRAKIWPIPDKDILALGQILIGKKLKRTPAGEAKELTAQEYFSLIGKPELASSFQTP